MELKAEDFVTKQQIQEWLGITAAQRYGFHADGLPFIKIGKTTLYHVPAVCEWLKRRERAAKPAELEAEAAE